MNARLKTWSLPTSDYAPKRLPAGNVVAEKSLWPWRSKAEGKRTEAGEYYVVAVLQSLAIFRVVSFTLGSALVFFLDPGDLDSSVLGSLVLGVGLFNVYRILWRFDPFSPRSYAEWASLCAMRPSASP